MINIVGDHPDHHVPFDAPLTHLDMGQTIRMVPFDPLPWDCIELNNPEDVPAIEAVLRQRGLA